MAAARDAGTGAGTGQVPRGRPRDREHRGGNLLGAKLDGASVDGADLRGTNLSAAELSQINVNFVLR
jgi:uncharacterized protein YjbI with pentapeptide repeats